MYAETITLFNYHNGTWHLNVIDDCNELTTKSTTNTGYGKENGDTINIMIHCTPDMVIKTRNGDKQYVGKKKYARSETVEDIITFNPETDFFYVGDATQDFMYEGDGYYETYQEDDYPSGLYYELNDTYDNIHMIKNASFYRLIPHFELEGR